MHTRMPLCVLARRCGNETDSMRQRHMRVRDAAGLGRKGVLTWQCRAPVDRQGWGR